MTMRLRVDIQLLERLRNASERYGMPISEIVRRALRWSRKPGACVVGRETRNPTTTGGECLKLQDIPHELVARRTPARIRAILRAYLDQHDRGGAAPAPELEGGLIEGVHYNVPQSEVLRRFLSR
ncbi:MAG: hypothetical protein A3K18_13505 [Lentisphaerae bacterium RIFOXYA12_64_32]|nr:MAG: hypothetical protein A3K18_13505 [Lentisphaerae bacterium RIFOXYA12_64_32]